MFIRNSAAGAGDDAGEPRDTEHAHKEEEQNNRSAAAPRKEDQQEDAYDRSGANNKDARQDSQENDNEEYDNGNDAVENGAAGGAELNNTVAEAQTAYTAPAQMPAPETLEELKIANARLRLITQITSAVVGSAPLDGQMEELARKVRAAFSADACIIRVLEGKELRLLAGSGIPIAQLHPFITVGWGISGEIMASRRPLVIADTRRHPATASVTNTLSDSYLFHAYAGVPLLAEGQVIGIMGLYSRSAAAFSQEDGEYLQIVAYPIAVAIANDRLYRRMRQQAQELEQQIADRLRAETALLMIMQHLQKSLQGTVSAMSSVVEMRDPYTAGHQRRVAILACVMAEHLRMDREQIQTLRIAGLLHDIGKISVPAQILCKPTALLAPEWAIIQTHAQVGYDILKDTALPAEVALVALQHHERLDGSGYPAGTRDRQILPQAQLMAVADVVEAMVSDRPYRPGLPIQAALTEITQHRGTRYQAESVDACMAVLARHEYELESLLAAWEAWFAALGM